MSAAPQSLFPLPVPILAKTAPLRNALRDDVQDRALDAVGCHGSSLKHRRRYTALDAQSDAYFMEARDEARARGMHRIADLIDRGLHVDAQETPEVHAICGLFDQAADACRHIVGWVESLLARRTAGRATGGQGR